MHLDKPNVVEGGFKTVQNLYGYNPYTSIFNHIPITQYFKHF